MPATAHDLTGARQGVRRPRLVPRPARRGRRPRRSAPRSSAVVAGAATRSSSATTCARPRPSWSAAFADGATAQGADVVAIGLARPTSSTSPAATSTCPARCSPRATTRRSYNGIKLCRAGRRARSARTPGSPRSATWPSDGRRRPQPRGPPGTVTAQRPARRLRGVPARARRPVRPSARCRSSSTPATAWPGYTVADRLRRAAARRRPAVLRARRHVPQPRGQPARPGEPASTCRRRCPRGRRPRPRLRRRRRPLLRRRRARRAGLAVRDHRAGRRPRAGQATRGAHRHPQPDHLAGGAGGRRASTAARRSAPGSGTRSSRREMARDRRGLRRRALRALLLPRLLDRRHRDAGGAARAGGAGRAGGPLSRARSPRTSATSPPARSTPWSPTRPRATAARRGRRSATGAGVDVDDLDGLTVRRPPDWWFNLRPSNTEPLLRLNVEAPDEADDGAGPRRGPGPGPRVSPRVGEP